MLNLSGEDDFTSLLVDDYDTGRFRARIDFELQIGRRRVGDLSLENDREWVPPEDSGPALFKSSRARRGVVGANGVLFMSKTGTLIFKGESFDSGLTSLSGNVRLDNDHLRFICLRHWLRVSRLFNRRPQSRGLASHPWVTIVIFARIVAHRV